MKKLFLGLFVTALLTNIQAQVETPAPSPLSKLEQKVGLTDVSIEYSRPGVKGRTIFGDLVPFDKLWRTGANRNTTISFSKDVTINGKVLKKGKYAIYSKPGKSSWEIFFYTETENWGTPKDWSNEKIALSTSVKVTPMPMPIETFTITIDDIKNDSAVIGFLWENVYVGVTFKTFTNKNVEKSITKIMNGPSPNDYYKSAVYYLEQGKDIHKAKVWINKAVELTKDKPRFWFLRQQSLILAKAGDKKGAIKAAKASLANAEKQGNENYVKKNKEFLAKMQ